MGSLVRVPGNGFIILEEQLPEDARFQLFSFYAGGGTPRETEYIGCMVGSMQSDSFVIRLRKVQGLLNMRYCTSGWHQGVSTLNEREYRRLDNFQKYTRAVSKVRNAYRVKRSLIISSNRIFAGDELAELEADLEKTMEILKDRYAIP